MLKYCCVNNNPLSMPTIYLTNTHEELYDLDREWSIKHEHLKGRDLTYYDRDIVDLKKDVERKKTLLLTHTIEKIKILNDIGKDVNSFKLTFNKYNGYNLEYKHFKITTFNYLNSLYVDIALLH